MSVVHESGNYEIYKVEITEAGSIGVTLSNLSSPTVELREIFPLSRECVKIRRVDASSLAERAKIQVKDILCHPVHGEAVFHALIPVEWTLSSMQHCVERLAERPCTLYVARRKKQALPDSSGIFVSVETAEKLRDLPEDAGERGHLLRQIRKEARQSFLAKKENVLASLPSAITDHFNVVGFARWRNQFLLARALNPYSIDGPARAQWLDKYEQLQTTSSLGKLPHLVYWYGCPDRTDYFSFVQLEEFVTFEEGRERKYDLVYSLTQEKARVGKKLSRIEQCRWQAWQDADADMRNPPSRRTRGIDKFKELHDQLCDNDLELLAEELPMVEADSALPNAEVATMEGEGISLTKKKRTRVDPSLSEAGHDTVLMKRRRANHLEAVGQNRVRSTRQSYQSSRSKQACSTASVSTANENVKASILPKSVGTTVGRVKGKNHLKVDPRLAAKVKGPTLPKRSAAASATRPNTEMSVTSVCNFIREMETTTQRMCNEKTKLVEEYETSQARLSQSDNEIAKLLEENQRLKEAMAVQRKELKDLRKDNASLSAECSALWKRLSKPVVEQVDLSKGRTRQCPRRYRDLY